MCWGTHYIGRYLASFCKMKIILLVDISNMQDSSNFYTNDKSNCPDNLCFAGKVKHSNKVMVWVTIWEEFFTREHF